MSRGLWILCIFLAEGQGAVPGGLGSCLGLVCRCRMRGIIRVGEGERVLGRGFLRWFRLGGAGGIILSCGG